MAIWRSQNHNKPLCEEHGRYHGAAEQMMLILQHHHSRQCRLHHELHDSIEAPIEPARSQEGDVYRNGLDRSVPEQLVQVVEGEPDVRVTSNETERYHKCNVR